MSHFSVTIRIPAPARLTPENVAAIAKELLYPYKEDGGWDEDKVTLKPYLTFHDSEEESRKDYETGTTAMVRTKDGVFSQFDDRFKNPDHKLFDPDGTKWVYPPGSTLFDQPKKERFSTFEEYMEEYEGVERDPETHRYGHWQNPNAKWDWFTVGGRWTGHFHLKAPPAGEAGRYVPPRSFDQDPKPASNLDVDFCRIEAIDFEHYNQKAVKDMEAFWIDWQALVAGGSAYEELQKRDRWGNTRDKALRMGILDCKNPKELTGKEWKTRVWGPGTNMPERLDVYSEITFDDLRGKFAAHFNSLTTYAFLDGTSERITLPGNGHKAFPWLAPGEMGWWGIDRAEVKDRQHFKEAFLDLLNRGDRRDWVVCVDCHI